MADLNHNGGAVQRQASLPPGSVIADVLAAAMDGSKYRLRVRTDSHHEAVVDSVPPAALASYASLRKHLLGRGLLLHVESVEYGRRPAAKFSEMLASAMHAGQPRQPAAEAVA